MNINLSSSIENLVETWGHKLKSNRKHRRNTFGKLADNKLANSTEAKSELKSTKYQELKTGESLSDAEKEVMDEKTKKKQQKTKTVKRSKSEFFLKTSGHYNPQDDYDVQKRNDSGDIFEDIFEEAFENPYYGNQPDRNYKARSVVGFQLTNPSSSSSDEELYEEIIEEEPIKIPPAPLGKKPIPLPRRNSIPRPQKVSFTDVYENNGFLKDLNRLGSELNPLDITKPGWRNSLETDLDSACDSIENLKNISAVLTNEDLGFDDILGNYIVETYIDEEFEAILTITELSRKQINLSKMSQCSKSNINYEYDSYIDSIYSEPLYEAILQTENSKNNQLQYIIEELLYTEKTYVENLEIALKKFMPKMAEKFSQSDVEIIFGNLRELYSEANAFCNLLQNCNKDCRKIAEVFINSGKLQTFYIEYLKNKPRSNRLLVRFQKVIKANNIVYRDLDGHLVGPLQRMAKYLQLLHKIRSELDGQAANHISLALDIVKNTMDQANTFIIIDSIRSSPINLFDKGPLLLKDNFTLIKPMKSVATVFLFQEIIVITKPLTKQSETTYCYIDSIQMNKLSFVSLEKDPLIFHIMDYEKYKLERIKDLPTFVLAARTPEIKTKWTTCIEKKLWQQAEEARIKLCK